MSDNQSSSGGISFLGLLGITFIVLKLCGVVSWSWWWVTAPLWAPIGIAVLIVIGMLIVAGFGWHKLKNDGLLPTPSSKMVKSKWETRLQEIRDEQIKKRQQNAVKN